MYCVKADLARSGDRLLEARLLVPWIRLCKTPSHRSARITGRDKTQKEQKIKEMQKMGKEMVGKKKNYELL